MSAIAQIWRARGHAVSGSDKSDSPTVQRLREQGVAIHLGHDASHVGAGVQGLVLSTAVAESNPEVVAARARSLPLFHRSHVLGALMRERRSIAVTGTHGKTTTTGMLASILIEAGVDPTVLVGGDLPLLGGTARAGGGDFLVAEADESDKSIRNLWAETVLLTNLEVDHLDHYRDLEEILEVMAGFIASLGPTAKLVACIDCPGVRRLLGRVSCEVLRYGFSEEADLVIRETCLSAGGSSFDLGGRRFAIAVPGRHNVSNAAGALAVAEWLGIDSASQARGIAAFTGVKRRFQTIGSVAGTQVIIDYAHHPSEIRAVLETARLLKRPVHAVFQPHRHSRLEALLEDFASSFELAQAVTLLDTYGAGEAPGPITAANLAERVRELMPTTPVSHLTGAGVAGRLAEKASEGELILMMGAGDIHALATPLLGALALRWDLSVQTA